MLGCEVILEENRAIIKELQAELSVLQEQAKLYNKDTFTSLQHALYVKYCTLAREHLYQHDQQHEKAMAILTSKMESKVASLEKLLGASVGEIVEIPRPRGGFPYVFVRLPYTRKGSSKGSGKDPGRNVALRQVIIDKVVRQLINGKEDTEEEHAANTITQLTNQLRRTPAEHVHRAAIDAGLHVKKARFTLAQQAQLANSMSNSLWERIKSFLRHTVGVTCDHKGASGLSLRHLI